jgi:ribosomal protein S18 acetylase RimI-like enzyme
MIRRLSKEDLDAYKTLRLHSLMTDPDAFFATHEEVAHWLPYLFENELRIIEGQPFGYYGYFVRNKLVGYISLQQPYYKKQHHFIELQNLYITPEYRKQGIGTELLKHVLAKASYLPEVESVHLSVVSANADALHLYQSLGFEVTAVRKRVIKAHDAYFDEILMEKTVV